MEQRRDDEQEKYAWNILLSRWQLFAKVLIATVFFGLALPLYKVGFPSFRMITLKMSNKTIEQ